jgi:hypothetical protein
MGSSNRHRFQLDIAKTRRTGSRFGLAAAAECENAATIGLCGLAEDECDRLDLDAVGPRLRLDASFVAQRELQPVNGAMTRQRAANPPPP